MLFNSYIFILFFLPLCLAGFWILSRRCGGFSAKVWLIGFSLWFYAYCNPKYLILLFVLMAANYGAYSALMRDDSYLSAGISNRRHSIIAAAVIFDLAILAYFKYTDFFISSINSSFHTDFIMKDIVLPLGISFIIFQQIGFVAGAYRTHMLSSDAASSGETMQRCSFVDYVLFTSFFPSISAGPITVADEMIPQFDEIGKKRIEGEKFTRGFILFVLGLSKKMLLADRIGVGVDYGWNNELSMQGPSCFIIMLLYSFQLYFDFSGYCDMGRGIAQMLGMDLPVNFDSPYKAVNIVDFWKRWHITLSRFLRDNLYIPLGGNRKGRTRTNINLFLVYLISGLWHGAGWNYIFWGALHGMLYVPTKMYLSWKRHRKVHEHNVLSVMLTFLYISFAWIYFRAPSIASGNGMIARMFDGYPLVDRGLGKSFNTGVLWYIVKMFHLDGYGFSSYLIMYVLLVLSVVIIFFMKNAAECAKKMKMNAGTALVCAVLLVCCIMSMTNVTSFIYYKF